MTDDDPVRAAPDPGQPAPPAAPEPPDLWDRAAAWVMQRGALPALGVITLAMVAIYAHMFAGELAGDDLTFHMAESVRIADCLRAGDFDFWNPSANAGFASAYYYQVVPQLISAIPAAVFGHHVFFFELSVFLPLVLAPAAAYRGMRLLGATPWQAAIAALAVGFTNGESRWGTGNAGTFQVGLYTQTWALAAFPLALGHAARWATQARGLAPAIAWGAFVTLCHPFAGVALGVALVAGWAAQLVLGVTDRLLALVGRRMTGDPARGAWSAMIAALGERWRNPPRRAWLAELARLALLGMCLFVAWMPIWLPLGIDYAGFGGFPHRVNDEVGPGFATLLRWYVYGGILDFARPVVLTWTVVVVALLARARFLRWLWAPAVLYAVWLGLGPHLGKTDDDLIPAVRFLGAMQVALSLAAGAGFLVLCRAIWNLPEDAAAYRPVRRALVAVVPASARDWARNASLSYGARTAIAATAAALLVLLTPRGAGALMSRVRVLNDFPASHGEQLRTIALLLQSQPPGRKQVGSGAENHWWNLLSYEYGRRPSLLMMGGGGLQSSPNYDFLWNTSKDFLRNAWVYDAPYLVTQKANAAAIPGAVTVFETKDYTVRRLPAPGLVSPVEVTGTLPAGTRKAMHSAALDWYRSEQAVKDRVLEYPHSSGSGGASGPPHGRVERAGRQDSPGDAPDIVAEVDATAPTTFMARESWHPRWQAYIDGGQVPVRRVTPDFLAVDAPAGHHRIALRFHRPWWAQAAWLAWPLVALIAWLATRLAGGRRATTG
ncbi:MAG TPA: hypothetical protein VHW23_47945 [Kofleriaceae bacterium]|jgi:hypothetical protein|nr:hypothetical protein [Kofleriaceae bacterium]